MKPEQIIKNAKIGILEQIKDKLQNIDNEEIYFHDIVTNEIDTITPTDRKECMALIDLSNTEHFDEGMIDRSSLDRTLITMAYLSIEDNLFNDDFIQELQIGLNNEKVSNKKSKEIIAKINDEIIRIKDRFQKPIYQDNHTQIFIKTSFNVKDLSKDDFLKYGLVEKQFIDLDNGIKILTSNKSINQNALVIEEKKKGFFRVYLMEKDKDLDIRNLFKLNCISEETGFNLSPSAYIEQTTEQYEEDKQFNKKAYLTTFEDKTQFIKQIVNVANKLTDVSIGNKTNNEKIKIIRTKNK